MGSSQMMLIWITFCTHGIHVKATARGKSDRENRPITFLRVRIHQEHDLSQAPGTGRAIVGRNQQPDKSGFGFGRRGLSTALAPMVTFLLLY